MVLLHGRVDAGETIEQPTPYYVAPIPAPEKAPNVLLVLTDDAGFGNPSAFGGPINTPTLERLGAGSPICVQVPLAGSYTSEFVGKPESLYPPATSTSPLGNNAAV